MSEMKKPNVVDGADVNEIDVVKVVEDAQDEERKQGKRQVDPNSQTPRGGSEWHTRSMGGIDGLIEEMKKASEDQQKRMKRELRRSAMDCIGIGSVCGLGVVSLIAAAVTDIWLPVAVGLGICLSGAAGILIYRGLVVLRK